MIGKMAGRLAGAGRRLLGRDKTVIPVIRLSGAIGSMGPTRQGMSLTGLDTALTKAFSMKAPAIALAINSPGGSPAQSSMIASRIRDLANEKNLKVYAFVEDVAASGGYWLACAADDIFADANSILGSIGVVSAGFGFAEFIRRHGVERRVYTSGSRKVILDPFSDEREDDVAKLKTVQEDIHENFRQLVRDRRGSRLAADEETLFNGDFWPARRALELGLIDGIGHLRPILRDRFGEKVVLRVVNPERSGLRERLGFGRAAGRFQQPHNAEELARAAMGAALDTIEDRAIWRRYGL